MFRAFNSVESDRDVRVLQRFRQARRTAETLLRQPATLAENQPAVMEYMI